MNARRSVASDSGKSGPSSSRPRTSWTGVPGIGASRPAARAATPASTTSAGRVIAGSARGTRLAAPPSEARPLGDRVKQTLFAIIEPDLRGSAFLDLFAGSGAAGIEALSRGAERAVFVDLERRAVATIEANLRAAHLDGPRALVIRTEAIEWLDAAARERGPFGAILLDPPYDQPGLVEASLRAIAGAGPDGILAVSGLAVAKHFWRDRPPADHGLLASIRERRFGETGLTFYRWQAAGEGGPSEEAG